MPDIRDVLAYNLKKYRYLNGDMSQTDLAEKSKVSLGTIQSYEGKRRWPEKIYLEALAKALSIEEHELFICDPTMEEQKDTKIKKDKKSDKKVGDITVRELTTIMDAQKEKVNFTKEEIKIIELLREKPHYASTIIKLLTPSNATTNNTTVSLPPKVDVAVRKRAK